MENESGFKTLNIAHATVTEGVNGPGRRFTVWFQGCPRRCEGCFNPDLLPDIPKTRITATALAALALSENIDGVTLSGGEPFLQAQEATLFLRAVKAARPDLDAIAFTGMTIEELRGDGGEKLLLLDALDLLVDGPFVKNLPAADALRGSLNQRLLPLTTKGEALLSLMEKSSPPSVEVTVSATGDVIVSGFPSEKLLAKLREKLSPPSL